MRRLCPVPHPQSRIFGDRTPRAASSTSGAMNRRKPAEPEMIALGARRCLK
jgi:hypothetical protein